MFPSDHSSRLGQRAIGALRLARSFLTLEDDYDVDWEVDREEPRHDVHPHRVPLPGRVGAGRLIARRAGQPNAPAQICVWRIDSPTPAAARGVTSTRLKRLGRCGRRLGEQTAGPGGVR